MRYRAFVPTLLLALVVIASKVTVAWPLLRTVDDAWRPAAVSAADVLLVLAYAAVAAVALRATRSRPRLHRAAWHAVVGLGSACAVYAVVSVAVFNALGVPMNVRMLSMARRFGDMRSSLAARCDAGLIVGLSATVILFVALGFRGSTVRAPRRLTVGLLAAAAAWVGWGGTVWVRADPDTWVKRAGINPHAEMLASLASQYLLDRRVDVGGPFPAEFVEDFRPTVATRRAGVGDVLPANGNLGPRAGRLNGGGAPRNVILVVMESTSAEYLSLYGASYDTTPHLVAETPNALVFDRFYANAGYTYRSVIPLVYSVYPGLPWSYRTDLPAPTPPGLASVLKARGYRTAFMAAANPEWGGMDEMARGAGFADVIGPEQLGGREASSWGTEDGTLIDGLLHWIDADPKRAFFAVAWTDQTHDPYTLELGASEGSFVDPGAHRHAHELNRYLSAIRQADRHLGRLFDALRRRGIADDTLVVVTGDHGEAFGDRHDVISHGTGLFDECVRVPMILWNPRLFGGLASHRDPRVGGHVDVNPTIAHLMGVEPLGHWQGASLFSPDHPGRAYAVIDMAGYQFSVADAGHKYILHATAGVERLYDLRADPGEQRDVSAEQGAVLEAMRGRVRAFVRAEGAYLDAAK